MIKAIFFDVDGTLLSHKTGQVPDSARQSLRQLREAGIQIFLSTGRHMAELDKLPMGALSFDGYITLNGQLCLDHKREVLVGTPLDDECTQKILSMFHGKEMPVLLVEEKRLYMNFVNDAARRAQQEVSTALPPIEEYRGAPIYQATVFLEREEEQEFMAGMPDGCKLARWSVHGADIIRAKGGKVAGIRCIQDRFGISTDEIMAFGDADNDIDMLKYAGIGVAMGNALKSVKEIADYVTADIDQDGILGALRHFGIL